MIRRLLLSAAAVVMVLVVAAAGATYWFLSRDGLRRSLEAQATAWLGHPVLIGRASGRLLPRISIRLSDVQVGDPVRLRLTDVDVSADLRPLLDGRIENAAVTVSGSEVEMPLPFAIPRAAEQRGAGEANPRVRIGSIRSIALRDIRLRSRGREIAVSAESSLEGTALMLSRFIAETGGTMLAIDGVVLLAPRIDAKLTAKANRLDLDELLALADAFTPSAATGRRATASRTRMTANIAAERATAGSLEVERLATQLALDGDAIELSPLTFDVFGGRYEGSVAARLGDRLSGTVRAHVAGVDVAQLAAFGGTPDTVTGSMSGDATFTGAGADIAGLLRGASGRGTAAIVDGSIRRLDLIRTIVLFFGHPAPDAEAATDRFTRAEASFSLADRLLRAEAFSLSSADAEMAGRGTLHLENDVLDGRVDITLSERLSAQAGNDLYRYAREGNRIVLPASIGGTLDAPRLTIDTGAAVKRGLRNEIERRLKGVLDGLRR